MLDEQIKETFPKATIRKGRQYYETSRIKTVLFLANTLYGEVIGQQTYQTEVHLTDLKNTCSCPLRGNCKHVVAVLLAYTMQSRVIDGTSLFQRFGHLKKGELLQVLQQIVAKQPGIARILASAVPLASSAHKISPSEREIRRVRRALRQNLEEIIDWGYAPKEWVDRFVFFVRENQASYIKDLVYETLDFLVQKEDDYGAFYDDYTDEEYGDPVFEALADVWVQNELHSQDFEKLLEIRDMTAYSTVDAFFNRLVLPENASLLVGFSEELKELLDKRQYLDFLINSGQTKEALDILLNKRVDLAGSERFKFLHRIDDQVALDFARNAVLDAELIIQYNSGKEILSIFRKALGSKTRTKMLVGRGKVLNIIFRAIQEDLELTREERKELQKKLLGLAYAGKHQLLCTKLALEINEDDVFLKLLPISKRLWEQRFDLALKVLLELKEKYPNKVIEELREFFKWAITSGVPEADEALQGLVELKKLDNPEEWETFLKNLYAMSYRKAIWSHFRAQGINLRKVKGKVQLKWTF
ncbi:MAG: SWIM zinc finger domain-containing protein [Candidatus Heimdallarchaeota archaeon]